MSDSAACASTANPGAQKARSVPGRWPQWGLLALLSSVLAAACLLQVLPSPNSGAVKRNVPLSAYFPRSLGGWTGDDRPLGDTESVSKAVKKILEYDEAFQRVYRKNGQEFVLYVAYWAAGKMPARDVGTHIPDQCWVGVGWKRTAVDYQFPLALEGHPLAPAQYREFDAPNDHEYVIYWHILDGKTILYSPDGPPSQVMTIKSLLRHGLTHKGEQYFIRISSRLPPTVLWQDEGFQAMMELVAPLGPGLDSSLAPY